MDDIKLRVISRHINSTLTLMSTSTTQNAFTGSFAGDGMVDRDLFWFEVPTHLLEVERKSFDSSTKNYPSAGDSEFLLKTVIIHD